MKEQIENLVEGLAYIRLRPYMYFSSEYPSIKNFLSGFSVACELLGVDIKSEVETIWTERGWKDNCLHPITVMREKGLSDDDINAEVFAVLILGLQRKYDISSEPVLKVHTFIREKITKAQIAFENSIHQTNESVAKTHSHVPHTLRAMDSLEKEMDIR